MTEVEVWDLLVAAHVERADDDRLALHELSSADARVVVAVGHDPLIEQAARRLDEDTPRLDEGAVAAFRLTGGLAWFVQGPDTAP